MASTKALVRVLDHGTEVESGVRRPIRLTPDGYAGVAYAGSVYPLRQGDLIDLSGSSWELADCDRFLFAGAEVPYAPIAGEPLEAASSFDVEWHLETNQFGHNVVFNASEHVASSLVSALEDAGLNVQRWDVSHRPADDGNFYDWFARLRFKAARPKHLRSSGLSSHRRRLPCRRCQSRIRPPLALLMPRLGSRSCSTNCTSRHARARRLHMSSRSSVTILRTPKRASIDTGNPLPSQSAVIQICKSNSLCSDKAWEAWLTRRNC
ncbi:hypothetical protein [Streptomyces longwoodensis]